MSIISRDRSRPMRPFAANHVSDRCDQCVVGSAPARTSGRSTVPSARRVWTRGR